MFAEELIDRDADLYAKAHIGDDDKTPLDIATSKKSNFIKKFK